MDRWLKQHAAPWVSGIVALLAMPAIVTLAAAAVLKDINAWLGIYIAGALGGLVLELMRSRWRVELPSFQDEDPPDASQDFAPHGRRVDIGFFGRLTTGGIAAPVFLILYAVIVDRVAAADLSVVAQRADTFAWGVLFGFASPAAWAAGEEWVKSRLKVVSDTLKREQEKFAAAEAELAKATTALDEKEAQLEQANSQLLRLTATVNESLGVQNRVVAAVQPFISLEIAGREVAEPVSR